MESNAITIERAQRSLELSHEQAAQVVGLIAGSLPSDEFTSVQQWLARANEMPARYELTMCALDEVLDGYGVSGILADGTQVESYVGPRKLIGVYTDRRLRPASGMLRTSGF